MDFSSFSITGSEKRVLRKLQRKSPDGILVKNLNSNAVQRLFEHDLVRIVEFHTGDLGCYITTLGYDYWLFARSIDRQRCRESVRYWITTSIAVLALILAVISLLSELELIRLA